MLRPVILRQAPGPRGDPARSLADGRVGARLAGISGVPKSQLGDVFELRNVLDRWPGRSGSGKGDAFPVALARAGVERVGDYPLPLSWRLALLSQAVAELSEMALWLREAEVGTGGKA